MLARLSILVHGLESATAESFITKRLSSICKQDVYALCNSHQSHSRSTVIKNINCNNSNVKQRSVLIFIFIIEIIVITIIMLLLSSLLCNDNYFFIIPQVI